MLWLTKLSASTSVRSTVDIGTWWCASFCEGSRKTASANLTGNPLRQLFWDQSLRQDPATLSSHPCREQLQGKLVCLRCDASKK